MGRTPEQIIEELKREGFGSVETVLIVAYGKGSDVIHYNDPRALKKLKAMMKKGGYPVGINRVKIEEVEGMKKGEAMSRIRPLKEYADNTTVVNFLKVWHDTVNLAVVFESEIDGETRT